MLLLSKRLGLVVTLLSSVDCTSRQDSFVYALDNICGPLMVCTSSISCGEVGPNTTPTRLFSYLNQYSAAAKASTNYVPDFAATNPLSSLKQALARAPQNVFQQLVRNQIGFDAAGDIKDQFATLIQDDVYPVTREKKNAIIADINAAAEEAGYVLSTLERAELDTKFRVFSAAPKGNSLPNSVFVDAFNVYLRIIRKMESFPGRVFNVDGTVGFGGMYGESSDRSEQKVSFQAGAESDEENADSFLDEGSLTVRVQV